MLDGLARIDWSSLGVGDGAAEVPGLLAAMASPDTGERERALRRFYSRVHHQGDVYRCTVAAMPFLAELADDRGNPSRADFVGLLAGICESCVDFADDELRYAPSGDLIDFSELMPVVRGFAKDFERWARDADEAVRCAAIPALAQFPDDPARVADLLRARAPRETGTPTRLLVLSTAGTLALRFPEVVGPVVSWLARLAGDGTRDPVIRLAALAQQARCAPGAAGPELVSAAIGMLAAERLDHPARASTPTTAILGTLHEVLGDRLAERTSLLTEQLRSPDPDARLDAIRMARTLIAGWRGDHSALIIAVAGELAAENAQVAREAAAVLQTCFRIAEPARELVADCVTEAGPDTWSAPDEMRREAHQTAVQVLARLGDVRALPSLLAGLDSDVDAWRAVAVAGSLPQSRAELLPRLIERVDKLDLAGIDPFVDMKSSALITAVGRFADPASAESLVRVLDAAIRRELWSTAASVAEALAELGPAAVAALPLLRTAVAGPDRKARSAALAALWAIGGEVQEVLPLLVGHLAGPSVYFLDVVAEILGQIGADATEAVPYLKKLAGAQDEWNQWSRVEAADALWRIAGEPATQLVLDALLSAWRENQATSNAVTATLERMGAAAAPALPDLEAELAKARRGGRFDRVDTDEDLQETCRRLILRLSRLNQI
ncbi:HEAT repeat domain-containing protein [Catenulispora sp. GP43]|uniref:HEAT repeat domain-containing protein n=1 Tax=Catenulispora sp. GP43 TaxID=3156263 RepID=UPI003514B914